jgi:transcription elongation GreA/GreB family factor
MTMTTPITSHPAQIGDIVTVAGIEGDSQPTRYLLAKELIEVITVNSPIGAAIAGAEVGTTVAVDHLGGHRDITLVDIASQ